MVTFRSINNNCALNLKALVCVALTSLLFSSACLGEEPTIAMSQGSAGEGSDRNRPVLRIDRETPGTISAAGEVLISAPPSVVWQAIHQERQHDPDMYYCIVVSQEGK